MTLLVAKLILVAEFEIVPRLRRQNVSKKTEFSVFSNIFQTYYAVFALEYPKKLFQSLAASID